MAALEDAVGRDLPTPDEGGERMATALSARFADELPPLTADLPAAALVVPPVPGWRALGSAVVVRLRREVQAGIAAGPRSRRVLVVVVVVVVALLAGLAVLGGPVVDGLRGGVLEHHVDLDR